MRIHQNMQFAAKAVLRKEFMALKHLNTEKINETNSQFFGKTNTIDTPFSKTDQKRDYQCQE